MKKRNFAFITVIIIIIIIVVTTIFAIINNKRIKINENQKVLIGRTHLGELEQMELSSVEDKIEKHHAPKVVIEDSDIDFYKFYENTVFMEIPSQKDLWKWS